MKSDYRTWSMLDSRLNQEEAWPAKDFPKAKFHYFKDSGCFATCLAILIRKSGIVSSDDWDDFNPWIFVERCKACGVYDEYADLCPERLYKAYPLSYCDDIYDYSLEKLKKALDDGFFCLLAVPGHNAAYHYVVADRIENNEVKIIDPLQGSGRQYSEFCFIALFKPISNSKENFSESLKIAKSTVDECHRNGTSGTALPGYKVMKKFPDMLSYLTKGIETTLVIGTIGKTTTTRMISDMMSFAGIPHITNRAGANTLSGIITAFAQKTDESGCIKEKNAVIECDEGRISLIAEYTKPSYIVLTNIFYDDYWRLGSLENIMDLIRTGIRRAGNVILCVNEDSKEAMMVADSLNCKKVFYSLKNGIPFVDGVECPVKYPIKADYYLYDAAAACAWAKAHNLLDTCVPALEFTKPAFGRMESFLVDGIQVTIETTKNKFCFDQVVNYLKPQKGSFNTIIWKDNSEDIDWDWIFGENLDNFIDIADELYVCSSDKVADYIEQFIKIHRIDEEEAYRIIKSTSQRTVILADYYGMLKARSFFAKKHYISEFWEN